MAEAKKKSVKTSKAKVSDKKVIKEAEKEAIDEAALIVNQLVEDEAIAEAIVEAEKEIEAEEESKPLAKAGKRSAKAVAEKEEKAAKEERKTKSKKEESEKVEKPRHIQKPPRTKLERAGKRLREATKQIDKSKDYSIKEAVELALKSSPTKFDATVELHVNLLVDPKQADQNVRDNVVLPAGTGKSVRVAVLADGDDLTAAKKAGADVSGADDFLQQLDKEKIDFDLLISTPTMMPKLGKYAKLLGPKGLMPNPKSGTVTTNIQKAVSEAKAGRVEYRVDSTGIVHVPIGKVSFGNDKIAQNLEVILSSIKSNKPATVKGVYIRAIHLTTSMGPSVRIAASEI